MLNRLMKNKKLTELIGAKKVDDSICKAIKENEKAYDDTKKEIKKKTDSIEKVNREIEATKQEMSELSIINVKERFALVKSIMQLKKEIKEIENEIEDLELVCTEKEEVSSELKSKIERQYTIYQENEILIKVVEKIESKGIDLPSTFYKNYIKHVNAYMNSCYSFKQKTTIKEPNVNDFAFLLGVLKKDEELNERKATLAVETNKSASKTAAKKTTKKATSPKKVVETITTNKVVKIDNNKTSKNTARNKSTKNEVVNQ